MFTFITRSFGIAIAFFVVSILGGCFNTPWDDVVDAVNRRVSACTHADDSLDSAFVCTAASKQGNGAEDWGFGGKIAPTAAKACRIGLTDPLARGDVSMVLALCGPAWYFNVNTGNWSNWTNPYSIEEQARFSDAAYRVVVAFKRSNARWIRLQGSERGQPIDQFVDFDRKVEGLWVEVLLQNAAQSAHADPKVMAWAAEGNCRFQEFSCDRLTPSGLVTIPQAELSTARERSRENQDQIDELRRLDRQLSDQAVEARNQQLASLTQSMQTATTALAASNGQPQHVDFGNDSGAPGDASAGMPGGSYSSWSEADKQSAAGALTQICSAQCAQYKSGQPTPLKAYEGAACTEGCFYTHLPSDYPGLAQIKHSFQQNYQQAKSLGSNIPVPAGMGE